VVMTRNDDTLILRAGTATDSRNDSHDVVRVHELTFPRANQPQVFPGLSQFTHAFGMLAADPYGRQLFEVAVVGHVEVATVDRRIHEQTDEASGAALLGFVIGLEVS